MTRAVFAVSATTLVLLFVLAYYQKKVKLLQILPPQLIAVVFGVILAQLVGLGTLNEGKFLMKIPNRLFDGFHAPHFGEMLQRPDLWYAAAMGVLLLTMIDGVESLATAMGIDRIDPYHRRSN